MLLLFARTVAAAAAGCLTVTDVAVFDAPSAALLPQRQDVRICGAHIDAVRPHTGTPPPPGDETLRGTGRTLLPGLIDLHTHIAGTTGPPWRLSRPDPAANLAGWLHSGVTTILEAGGTDATSEHADATAADPLAGPAIHHAGRRLSPPLGHLETTMRLLARKRAGFLAPRVGSKLSDPMLHRVETEADIRAAIAHNVSRGARFTKVDVEAAPGDARALSPALLAFLVAEAERQGAPALAHVGGNADTEQALDAGVRFFAHSVNTEPLSAAVLSTLREREAVVLSTLLLPAVMTETAAGRWQPSPLDQQQPGSRRGLRAVSGARGKKWRTTAPEFVNWIDALSEGHAPENVRRMRAAGVAVLPGTDSVIPAALAGPALHRELALLVESGAFTAGEALSAATHGAAVFLGEESRVGRVEAGWEADLLLVAGDPTKDVGRTQKIEAVFRRGARLTDDRH